MITIRMTQLHTDIQKCIDLVFTLCCRNDEVGGYDHDEDDDIEDDERDERSVIHSWKSLPDVGVGFGLVSNLKLSCLFIKSQLKSTGGSSWLISPIEIVSS